MENSELRKEFEAYSRRASKYTEQGEIKNAALFQKYADQVLLEMNGTAEKKNPSEAGYSSSESKSADGAEQQPLSPQKESFDSNDDSVVLESVSSSRNSLGGKKWIGLSHVSKFKSVAAYKRYTVVYNRLRHKLRNWVKSIRKRAKTQKMKDILDDAEELRRLIRNDALREFGDELLNIEYTLTIKGESYVFGLEEGVLKGFFRD